MASQVSVGDNSNTKSGEGTVAFLEKRARRVSFAENTSVHIFDRDEDSGTPVNPKLHNSPSVEFGSADGKDEDHQLFWNVEEDDNDNNNEDDDLDEPGSSSPFLRLVRSPSSGGSTIGSANSNDEDNFFGPVSANFIRRDLLDSAPSDGNHDQTMDSTAFSMHFRSIARSDSEIELKTSTGVHLSFEEKTPAQDSVPTNTATSMLMTLAKKPSPQQSISTSEKSTCFESNDMSIIGEYRYKYNYGNLSPTVDALLAEGNKDLRVVTPSHVSISGMTKENGTNVIDFKCNEDNVVDGIIAQEMVKEGVSLNHNALGTVNDGSRFSPSKQIALGVSSDAEIYKHLLPSSSVMVTPTAKELVKDAFQIKSSLDFSAISQGNTNRKGPMHSNDVIVKELKSPFVGSMTSLTDKSGHMILEGATQSNVPLAVTPQNNSSAFVRAEIPNSGSTVPSVQKSMSKLIRLEASPFSAALIAKLEVSTSRFVVSHSKMTPLSTVLKKNYKAPLLTGIIDSEQLSSASQKKRGRSSSTNVYDIKLDTQTNVVPVTHVQNFVKDASPLSIPPESTLSGEKLQIDLMSSAETRYGHEDKIKRTGSPQNLGSPQKKLKIVNTSECESSPLGNAKQFFEHKEPEKFGARHIAGSRENVANASFSTAAADWTDGLYIERIEKSSPLVFTEEELVDITEVSLHEDHCNSGMKEKSTTLLTDEEHEKLQPNLTGSDRARGGEKQDHPVSFETRDRRSCQNFHNQICPSPPNEKPHNVLHDDNVGTLPEDNIPSPGNLCLSNGNIISEQEREADDAMVVENARSQRSPSLKNGYVGTELSADNQVSTIARKFKHPAEMYAMLSNEMKELLSQSVEKLNLHAIDHLAGIVDQLLMSKTYQLLSEEIQSQKLVDASKNIPHNRYAEMKQILCKFVHEKAKLQLLNVNRERLVKRAKSLAFNVLESEGLKSNFSQQQSSDVRCMSLSVNMKDAPESQIHSNKVTSMGQTIDHIDRGIANLTESLHKSCKMKRELSPENTVAFITNYLEKRACCQIIRKDLQLWVVENLESRNNCHIVILNYLDLMTQRLSVTTNPVPSITISHELNNTSISKIFKDMDACTAFGFVFNVETTQKHAKATCLEKETQVTSSRLRNLLDVAKEIQHARLELKTLISTKYGRPLAERLDLELCFFDPKTRRKATITLDTSCLRSGIYPSEIIPYQIDVPVDEQQKSSSLAAEIAETLNDLKAGYLRIQRLCICISKLISHPIR